jgi:DNA polymerase III alpha subunit
MVDAERFEAMQDKAAKATYTPFENFIDYQKYYHLTMHFRNQHSYETAVRLLSFADARAEKHGSELKPLFSWKELEEIGASDTVFASSCLIGMVQRHLAFGENHTPRPDLAEAYYKRLRSIVKPGNFFVEIFPHVCDRNWESAVIFTHEDGTTTRLPAYRNVKTDRRYSSKHGGMKAQELAELWETDKVGHGAIRELMFQKKWQPAEPAQQKKIIDIKFIEQFLMNECTAFSPNGDLQKPCNEFLIGLAQKYGDKILISDDSHFVLPDEKIVQDVKLMQDGNWRFASSYHRQSGDEAWKYFRDVMNIPQVQFESWLANSREWSGLFKDFKFAPRQELLPVKFYPQDTLAHTMKLIQKHGRQGVLRDPVYYDRLRAEIDLLHRNGKINLLPYFFIDEEVVDLHQLAGELTGPGRGSAAGLLLCYLLEITHVDPLRYGLSMDRFMTQDRIKSGKMPDIDQDLPHRDLLVDEVHPENGWLVKRFGDHVVQISTDMTIRMRQGVLDVHRIRAPDRKVPPEVADLTKQFQKPPQGINDHDHCFGYDNNGEWVEGAIKWDPALMEYIKRYPNEWEIVQKCMGIGRGKSRHACAFLIANEPVHNFIPLTSVGGVKVTQPTAAQVESSGGLKMDFLIVNSLKDIGNAIKLIQQRSGDTSQNWNEHGKSMIINGKKVPLIRVVPHKGQYVDIWDLPEYQPVFRDICEGNTASSSSSVRPAPSSGCDTSTMSAPPRTVRNTRQLIASRPWLPSRPSIAQVPSMPS